MKIKRTFLILILVFEIEGDNFSINLLSPNFWIAFFFQILKAYINEIRTGTNNNRYKYSPWPYCNIR